MERIDVYDISGEKVIRTAGRAEVTEMLSSGQFVDYDGKLIESLFDEGAK